MLETTNNGNGKEKHYIMGKFSICTFTGIRAHYAGRRKKNTPACCTLYIVGNAGRNFCYT